LGQINIDVGRISEDFYVRQNTTTFQSRRSLGNLNTEDFNLNGLLEDDEDVGLDGVPSGHPNDDPWDDWIAPQQSTPPFIQINGTENNGSARGAKYPDTEDLDGDGGLNQTNEYFTYSFSLADSVHPYIKGSTPKGWKLYRIPIRNYDPQFVVGRPDTNFREIFFSRLWVNDLPQDNQLHRIQIATFDFVGNEWEEIGVALNDLTPFVKDDSLFSLSVYNTEENVEEVEGGPEAYQSPPNVTGIIDRITRAKSKEQSLVLQLGRLEPGAKAEAMKQLFEKMNLINYANLRMFVHGDRNLPDLESPLEFFVRFGPTESIYYEVGTTVYPHWDERNQLDVVLDDLAKTRQEEFATGDTLNTKYAVYYRTEPENPEKYFMVVGEPNLRNINFIIIGARNIGDFPLENMEIWLDEFRVTNVERDKGTAMRILTDLQMADVANFRAQFELTDADFRRIEDQFGAGSTTERQQYRFGLKLNKFFPSSWGLNIPISGGLVRSKSVPKYFYNTDQLTNYKSEGFGEKLKQIFGMNELDPELEKDSRIQESKSLGATFQRRGTARAPWYLKYSIDMITLDVDWNEKHASDERNLFNDDKTLSAQFQLNVPFGNQNSVKPFSWLGNGPIVRKLANQEIFYTPSSLGFNVGIRDNETKRQARLETSPTSTIRTTSTRRANMTYKLFPSLTTTISRDHQADAFLKGYRAKDLVSAIFSELDFGIDKVVNQNFSATYNPQIFKWMTQSLKYTSGFNYNYSNVNTNEKSSRLQVSKQVSVKIQPTMLANSIYNPAKSRIRRNTQQPSSNTRTRSRSGPRSRSSTQTNTEIDEDVKQDEKKMSSENTKPPASNERSQEKDQLDEEGDRTRRAQPRTSTQQQEEEQSEEKKKKKILPSLKYINPLLWIWKVFDSWKSVNMDYRIQDSYNYFNIEKLPTINHQFGFDPEPGVDEDTTFNKIPRLPGIRNGKNVSGGLTFDIIKNLSSTFKYNYNKDLNQNNQQRTETIASTYFFTGEDPEANKKFWHEFIPDWQLRLTGLEKIKIFQKLPFFTKVIKTLSLEHARSGKFNENNRYDEIGTKSRDNWGFSNSYSPFFGMTINTPFGINGNIRYTKSSVFSFNTTGAANKSLRSGFDVTMSFRKTGGFNLPLPFLKNKKLKNEMQFNLSLNTSSDIAFSKRSGSDKFEEQTKNRSFKAKPSVTYRFSPKVNGSMFFEQSISENKRTGTYSYFEFGVNVNIAIR
jgi:cell surface protein SprA